MRLRVLAGVAIAAITMAGCRDPGPSIVAPSAPSSPTVELTIYAAASLKGAMDAAKAAYETANPGTTLVISTDSSAALAAKIEQGAPADVFLSADTATAQKLVAGGFAVDDMVIFARNELAVIVPLDNPAGIQSAADLAQAGLRIIAAGDEVPITGYASELLANIAAQSEDPDSFEAAYAANIVSREDNVKSVVAKIELGEGDAAIVYATDAAASTKVAAVEVPPAANVTASYAGVVVATSRSASAAGTVLDWLAGPAGRAVLAGFGFKAPAP